MLQVLLVLPAVPVLERKAILYMSSFESYLYAYMSKLDLKELPRPASPTTRAAAAGAAAAAVGAGAEAICCRRLLSRSWLMSPPPDSPPPYDPSRLTRELLAESSEKRER